MGHLVGKDVYRKLGTKVDGLTVRAPWNETMRAILKELCSPEEAEVFIGMPYGFATLDRIARSTGHERVKLQGTLERLAEKGLVVDFEFEGGTQYMPSPLFVGIFEFTMMRTGPGVDSATLGKLFHAYLNESGVVEANAAHGEKVTIMRALPHDGAVREHVEILDYEKASAILAEKERFALGICSCRHEKLHAGVRECDGPLDVCSSFDRAADFLVRHGMAREVSKAEMQDNLTRSRERGLVLSADNVQKNAGFICNCCACCCNLLRGVRDFGYPNFIVTSSFIASPDQSLCQGCGKRSKACPIEAIEMLPLASPAGKKKKEPRVDAGFCLGCGVCTLDCSSGAMRLDRRGRRVIHPETTFERVILQCLERGTLQNQIFDDPGSLTQDVMRAILGAFLRLPPVKRALMSDALRSRFLAAMKAGVSAQGKGELVAM